MHKHSRARSAQRSQSEETITAYNLHSFDKIKAACENLQADIKKCIKKLDDLQKKIRPLTSACSENSRRPLNSGPYSKLNFFPLRKEPGSAPRLNKIRSQSHHPRV